MGLRELPPARRCEMGVFFAENARPLCRICCNFPFHAVLLFAIGLIGCNSTCYTFVSNPPTGTIGITVSDPSPTCKLTTAKGAVRIQMDTELACAACAVQHIFVSLQGIEVHPSMTADEDSLDWQELLPPELVKQPLQVDLVKSTADRGGRGAPLGESVAIPAGIYRQARLRFVPNQPETDGRLPEKNACGGVGFNCVVLADGRIQPLELDGGSPELRITSDRIKGASLFVPPDTDTDLIIELKLVWVLFLSADQRVCLLPALTGSIKDV